MHGTLPWDNKFRALLSTPYVTGVVLHDRKCWLDQFRPERIADAELDTFIRERIQVATDDSVEGTGARGDDRTGDGRTLSDRRAYPRGDMADPLSRKEIVEKFRESAGRTARPDDTERAIDMLVGLADLAKVADLCATLSAASASPPRREGVLRGHQADRRAGRFAAAITYDDLPASTREFTPAPVLDSVASALAGDLGDETADLRQVRARRGRDWRIRR